MVVCFSPNPFSTRVQAGDFGDKPPSIRTRAPDHGLDLPPFAPEILTAWSETTNQNHLIEQIRSYKYGYSGGPICNAKLPKELILEMGASQIGQLMLEGRFAENAWFDNLDTLLDRCGWFYLPLLEYTQYDLLVFSEAEAKTALPLLDRAIKPVVVTWKDNQAIWPPEPSGS